MTRCSCYWADVSHLVEVNQQARQRNQQKRGKLCFQKGCHWCSGIILCTIKYSFSTAVQNLQPHSRLNLRFCIDWFQNSHQFLLKDFFLCPCLFLLLLSNLDMPKPPEDDVFIFPDEYRFIPRNKRAVLMKNQHSRQLNVEMLVVVDGKMMDNHGHENITTYVLTVLNMVRTDAETVALN